MILPSQDVRMKRSASYPEMDNCLNCFPRPNINRPLYKWQDDDDNGEVTNARLRQTLSQSKFGTKITIQNFYMVPEI